MGSMRMRVGCEGEARTKGVRAVRHKGLVAFSTKSIDFHSSSGWNSNGFRPIHDDRSFSSTDDPTRQLLIGVGCSGQRR